MKGKIVWHKSLGKGEISEVDDSYIQILFDEEEDVKKFAYPEAFRSFLKFEDSELQEEAQSKIIELDDIERQKKELEEEETERRNIEEAEEKAKALKEKRAAAAKKRKDVKEKSL